MKSFHDLKLRNKLLVAFLLIIFLSTVLVNYSVYKIYEHESITKSTRLSQNVVDQLAVNVVSKTRSLEESLLFKVHEAHLFETQMNPDALHSMLRDKRLELFATFLTLSGIEVSDVLIVDRRGTAYAYVAAPSAQASAVDVYEYIKTHAATIQRMSGKPLWMSFPSRPEVIYIVRAALDLQTTQYQGMIAVGIHSSYLRSLYAGLQQPRDGAIAIY